MQFAYSYEDRGREIELLGKLARPSNDSFKNRKEDMKRSEKNRKMIPALKKSFLYYLDMGYNL